MNSIVYPRIREMSVDMDEDMSCKNEIADNESTNSDVEDDIEEMLSNLSSYDNEKQLNLLRKEIGHIYVHGMTPPEGWYDERYRVVYEYSKLGWLDLARRFHGKDEFIHNTAITISRDIDELLEERSTRPNFHMLTYYNMINNIYNVWHYYKKIFVDEDNDTGMNDLIEGMKFL